MTDLPLSAPQVSAAPGTSSDWLLLACLPRFGARVRRELAAVYPNLADLLALNAPTLKACGLAPGTVAAIQAWQRGDAGDPVVARVAAIERDCARLGISIIPAADARYPEPLRHIHDAPLVLYVRGDPGLLHRDQIGIVGSRHATRAGLDHARAFARELSGRNLLVTSGLALGVDGAAHAGALDTGAATVAVIGCGLDRVYPSRHRRLAERVVAQGLLVSEYPPGTPARAAHFPQRNRIISGLSRGVLVVEAGLKSGSLITARLALEQGREVFAIPGSVHNPVARGCHQLIRQGATLVETVNDILAELGTWWSHQPSVNTDQLRTEAAVPEAGPIAGLARREIAVFQALGYDPQSTDALSSATGLPADQLMQSLLLLELQGLVSSAPGGFLRIA